MEGRRRSPNSLELIEDGQAASRLKDFENEKNSNRWRGAGTGYGETPQGSRECQAHRGPRPDRRREILVAVQNRRGCLSCGREPQVAISCRPGADLRRCGAELLASGIDRRRGQARQRMKTHARDVLFASALEPEARPSGPLCNGVSERSLIGTRQDQKEMS